MTPVDLRLFARQGLEAQIGLRGAVGAQLGDMRAELTGSAAIAARPRHGQQPGRGEARILCERLEDQRMERIDDRGARSPLGFR